ncbi:MAG: triose-phosphate isomerase [Candidatus Riflebacteria bacterium]|nr:triose-phosphate isomerase [Candidatus Riflebacteria bacterium]
MNSLRRIIFVSDKIRPEELVCKPFSLQPEDFVLTSFEFFPFMAIDSLKYSSVVIDFASDSLLRKLSLGIRDSSFLESLATLLKNRHIKAAVLTNSRRRQTKPEAELELEPVIPEDCRSLLDNGLQISTEKTSEKFNSMITSDDIYSASSSGTRFINIAGKHITPWAQEIADSLNIRVENFPNCYSLVKFAINNRSQLESAIEQFNDLAHSDPSMLFVCPPLYWGILADSFPSILKRTIAPCVFTAEKGAFTGEVSIEMLADFGLRGAILPERSFGYSSDLLNEFLSSAAKNGLLIFSKISLETQKRCDIMIFREGASGSDNNLELSHLYDYNEYLKTKINSGKRA